MREFLMQDHQFDYFEAWQKCRKDPNCMGIVQVKGRRRHDTNFMSTVQAIKNCLMNGETVGLISHEEKYIDAVTEMLEMAWGVTPKVEVTSDEGIFCWSLTVNNMKYQKGKLYESGTLTVLCTGVGLNANRFSGVVVEQLDPVSDFQLGNFCSTFNANENIFKEKKKSITIDPAEWKEPLSGNSTGPSNH